MSKKNFIDSVKVGSSCSEDWNQMQGTARPHVAMGVPKGAGDALALVKAIKLGGGEPLSALGHFEAERLRIDRAIVARGRYLGSYMEAQLKSEEERSRAEALRVPERVMMETAAPMAFA